MISLDMDSLRQFKLALEEQISEKEKRQQQLTAEIDEMKKKLEALKCLIGQNGNRPDDGALPPPIRLGGIVSSSEGASPTRKGAFTPVYVYWPAILGSLDELGGSARGDEVVELVGNKLDKILTLADREMLPSGTDVRWRNRVQWQRYNMIRQGLLRNDSPRGTWVITDKGRKWLDDLKRRTGPTRKE